MHPLIIYMIGLLHNDLRQYINSEDSDQYNLIIFKPVDKPSSLYDYCRNISCKLLKNGEEEPIILCEYCQHPAGISLDLIQCTKIMCISLHYFPRFFKNLHIEFIETE